MKGPRSFDGPRAPLVARLIATVGHTGFFPWAPATLASLIVAAVYFILPPLAIWVQAIALVVVTLVGIITATMMEQELGHDAGPIVIDEVAGMIMTYLLVPIPEAMMAKLAVLGAGFVFFRIFDIFKPWPVAQFQNLPAGRGVVADDIMAGLYSNIALQGLLALGFLRWISGVIG
ncbi:MAG: phosphatidylglycerophosphatase A [Candidatus Eisenbacteria bacterium]|nr:phosphatidylglycerophosphatase A [Candidatus Eisenbacteria bacterium]